MDAKHPQAEVHIDEELIRALLRDQHPDLVDEELVLVDAGWDNVTHRLGNDLAVRVPRREASVALLINEQRWLPVLGPRIGVAVPMPVRTGESSDLFRWPWSVVRWIPGETADLEPLRPDQASRIGIALRALHRPAPDNAPRNPFRGGPLMLRHDFMQTRLDRLSAAESVVRRLRGWWADGLEAPPAETREWLHGDLHPRNVLVRDGRLAGIIDWGDLTAGDPATDLSAAWTVVSSAEARAELWEAYGGGDDVIVRARAWAVFFGVVLSECGEDRHERIGRSILEVLLASCARPEI